MSDMQKFDDNIIKNLHMFSFKDDEQIYTNGVELVPLFRVIQILEHFKVQELVDKAPYYEELAERVKPTKPKKLKEPVDIEVVNYATHKCSCGFYLFDDGYENYCCQCGQKIDWSEDEPK